MRQTLIFTTFSQRMDCGMPVCVLGVILNKNFLSNHEHSPVIHIILLPPDLGNLLTTLQHRQRASKKFWLRLNFPKHHHLQYSPLQYHLSYINFVGLILDGIITGEQSNTTLRKALALSMINCVLFASKLWDRSIGKRFTDPAMPTGDQVPIGTHGIKHMVRWMSITSLHHGTELPPEPDAGIVNFYQEKVSNPLFRLLQPP